MRGVDWSTTANFLAVSIERSKLLGVRSAHSFYFFSTVSKLL